MLLIISLVWFQLLNIIDGEKLYVTHNGPAVFGATITFNAAYGHNEPRDSKFEYTDSFHLRTFVIFPNKTFAQWNITFSEPDKSPGKYFLFVEYSKWFLFYYQYVTETEISFDVTNTLNTDFVSKSGNNVITSQFVSSKDLIEHYIDFVSDADRNLLKQSKKVTVNWYIDCNLVASGNGFSYKANYSNTDQRYMLDVIIEAEFYNLTDANPRILICNTKQFIVNSSFRYAHVFKEIIAKDPISNISIQGNGWLSQGNALNLQLYCNGSSTFYYCVEYYDTFLNGTANLTCEYYLKADTCSIPIYWYYYKPGQFTVLVFIKNRISSVQHNITVNVYEIKKQGQLSVVIVPIFFTLVSIIMIIFGIGYFVQRRRELIIEEASFDFNQHDVDYQTFTQRLKNEWAKAIPNQLQEWFGSTQGDQSVLITE